MEKKQKELIYQQDNYLQVQISAIPLTHKKTKQLQVGNKLMNLYDNYESIHIKSIENILKRNKALFKNYVPLSENYFYQHQIGQEYILKTCQNLKIKKALTYFIQREVEWAVYKILVRSVNF